MKEILRIVIPLIIGLILSSIIKKTSSKEKKVHILFLESLGVIILWLIIGFYILFQFPFFDKTWETILASSGILTAVLGLAAQSSLTNIFSGISISVGKNKPFEINDRIKIGNYDAGYVKNVTLRHVEIETYFHQTIFIPNKVVSENNIINYTKEENSSYPVEIMIAYDSDIEKAIYIFSNVIKSHPKFDGENPLVLCKEAQDSGILLRATVTTKDFNDTYIACSDVLKDTIKAFRNEGIEIPYNKLEIREMKN